MVSWPDWYQPPPSNKSWFRPVRGKSPGVGKCPAPGTRKNRKCPTPGTYKARKWSLMHYTWMKI